ncbi:MFS transporter [Marinitoga sp. 38H-ov]|uniref:MFS transporter n=1 Tax=Marinitoga sp. 38H-ov TaxID=1755814 RepID=UPI0013EDD1AD|nr:MFS transporter [Marinitoga sp. 38H-ov]KAF2955251.1 hypothetical protein AS160_01755 [Marinitoga sp. 38H-ov]
MKRSFIFIIILISSLYINSISPLMTTFQETFNVTISQSSALPFTNTIGNIIFATIAGFIISTIGLRNSLISSFFFLILSILIFIFSNNFLGLILAMFFVGGGLGQVFSVTTSMYDHLDEKLQNYGLFHAFFGLGGIIGPLLVSLFLKFNLSYRNLFSTYLILISLLLLYIFITKKPENIKYESFSLSESFILIKKRIVIISLIMLMLYAGSEIGSITWAANLFKNSFNFTKESSAIFISLFWLFFTFGRVISDKLFYFFKEKTSFYLPIISSITLLILFFLKIPFIFAIYGLFLGPIFPATQKYLNAHLSHREVGLISGLVFAGTGIGSMIITTTMGFIADYNVIASYFLPCSILILIGMLSLIREGK